MAEGVNIIEELFADSDSDGEENFEGFDLHELETSRNAQNNLEIRTFWMKIHGKEGTGFPKSWHSMANMACWKILITLNRRSTFLNFS